VQKTGTANFGGNKKPKVEDDDEFGWGDEPKNSKL